MKAEILPIAVYLALSSGEIGMLAALIIISAVLAEISLIFIRHLKNDENYVGGT